MLSNKIFSIPTGFSTLVRKVTRGMLFPNKKEKRVLTSYRVPVEYQKDDLAFPWENEKINGGPQKFADFIKRTPDIKLFPLNMAFVSYNLGKKALYEPIVFEEIERHAEKYKGSFSTRFAFGCLYGFLRTNAGSEKGIQFFEEELLPKMAELSVQEKMELFDAYISNTTLELEHISNFVTEHIKPSVLENWKLVHYKPKTLLHYFTKLSEREWFDQEIWDALLASMQHKRTIKKLEDLALVHKTLLKIQETGKFYKDLAEEITVWTERITTNHENYTRYNIEEMRYFTFEEMKAKRDEYNFPDQQYKIWFNPKFQQTDEMSKLSEEERQKAIAQQEEKERDVTFDEIVNQRISSLKKGDLLSPFQDLLQDDESKEVLGEYEEDDGEEDEIGEATRKETAKAMKQRVNTDKKLRKQVIKEKKTKEAE